MSGPAALTPPRSRRPLLLAIAVLWAIVGALLAVSLSLTGGQVTLALDDAYIHLAMAKNFALHGVWGVTRHAFSSASSSPLWTLTMATLFKLLGPHPVLALVVNLILGTVLVVAVDRFLAVRHPDVSDRWRAGAALAVALVTPVPTMVLIGMEHTAAALFTIVFAHLVASELALADPRRTVAPATLLSGALVTTIRYEGLFLVAAACLLYALRRRVRGAVLLAATALAPLVAYGAVSAAASWDWLPATVLLKGKRPAILDDSGQVSAPRIATTWLRTVATTTRRLVEALGYSSYSSIVGQPPLLALVAIALVAWFARASRGPWEEGQVEIVLFLATAFGHMQFARAGWFYRYEAYLVTFGAYVASRWLLESTGTISRWITTSPSPAATALAATALALFALVPVVQRALWATLSAPRAAANIHQQQRQVARFLKAHYEGAAVALIDVGLANFEVDLRCLDMAGLADLEVWREVKAGRWSADALAAMAARRGVVLAVMHQGGWLPYPGRGPPAAWRAMGSWRIPLNVVCAHDTVTFHAPGPDSRQRLADSLEAFTPHLAPGVVPGEYLR